MILSLKDYKKMVLGCWMGKNIGGTLGAPMEWKRQVNDVSFYTQELDGNPLPNDDLDLQLVWLTALEEKGLDINARILGEYWHNYIEPHWAEYGNGKINMRAGLMPPLSGNENNPFKHSCGAFIRSEIWACIAPGCPAVATRYAYEDAIVDHGNGEGMYAEIFCAALESAAFVEKDVYKLIDIGLSYIPEDCGVAKAVKCAIDSYKSGKTWIEARDEMLEKYRGSSGWFYISERDREKGFADGIIGWDAPSNIGITIIGWLYGEGDFEKSMCITVNCGEDTDCTAATLGSIFGILHGIDAISQKWIEPIGSKIKTLCINLGDFWTAAESIEALTDRVERLARQVVLRFCPHIDLSESKATDLSDYNGMSLFAQPWEKFTKEISNGPVYTFETYDVMVDYNDGPYVKSHSKKKIRIRITNKGGYAGNLNLKWYLHEGWSISPSRRGKIYANHGVNEIECELSIDEMVDNVNRFVLEITVDGRHTVILIPVILLNGNYRNS